MNTPAFVPSLRRNSLAMAPLFALAAIAAWFALAGTAARAAPAAKAAEQAAQDIVALEKQLGAALSRVDVPLIDKLWAPDLQYISPGGKVFDKTQRLASVRASAAAPPVVSSVDDVQVRVYGNTAIAIVRTTWRGQRDGKDFADAYIATHVWVKSAAGWRLAGAQVTPLSGN